MTGPEIPRAAVIGGGFSGTLSVIQLIVQAREPLTIEWFERSGAFGPGLAYSTQDINHLLNVRAAFMGAFPDRPGHFYDWLSGEEGREAIARHASGFVAEPQAFAPRVLYGAYLQALLDEALLQAESKKINIRKHPYSVEDMQQDPEDNLLLFAQGFDEAIRLQAAVLATGHGSPRKLCGLVEQTGGVRPRYHPDVWRFLADAENLAGLQSLGPDSLIVLAGTGLTMVDLVLTLTAGGYQGNILALSRNGLLPASHKTFSAYSAWAWVLKPEFAPKTALGLLKGIRKEIRRAAAHGQDWRAVVDSLRPVTQKLWQQLGLKEKQKFQKRLATFWNVHRHRMGPQIHERIEALLKQGKLKIIASDILAVQDEGDYALVTFRRKGVRECLTVKAEHVFSCAGAETNIAEAGNSLLTNMKLRGLLQDGPLCMGVRVTSDGAAAGTAPQAIYPVGALLAGELYETTAVPELRAQALKAAQAILNRLGQAHSGGQIKDQTHLTERTAR